jgi:hypothetical protein
MRVANKLLLMQCYQINKKTGKRTANLTLSTSQPASSTCHSSQPHSTVYKNRFTTRLETKPHSAVTSPLAEQRIELLALQFQELMTDCVRAEQFGAAKQPASVLRSTHARWPLTKIIQSSIECRKTRIVNQHCCTQRPNHTSCCCLRQCQTRRNTVPLTNNEHHNISVVIAR